MDNLTKCTMRLDGEKVLLVISSTYDISIKIRPGFEKQVLEVINDYGLYVQNADTFPWVERFQRLRKERENKKFNFTAYNSTTRDGLTTCMVAFVPEYTIECSPPYIEGKWDSCRIKYRNRPKSKEELERCIGMSIREWE